MIAIINVTENLGKGTYGKGTQTYKCQINDLPPMFHFEHNFEEGLAQCLYQAYIAACKYEAIEKEQGKGWPY